MSNHIIVAKLGAPHGVHGEIKCYPITDRLGRLLDICDCFILDDKENITSKARIKDCKLAGNMAYLSFEEKLDRTQVQEWTNHYIAIPKEQAVSLEPGRFFIVDLIGCKILDQEEGLLGTLQDILFTGAHDVFVVRRDGKRDLLIPFLHSIVSLVDIENKKIQVKLPEGLLEIYE